MKHVCVVSSIILAFVISACQTAVERQTSVQSRPISTYTGYWQGGITCKLSGYDDLPRHLEVEVKDGEAQLSHLGNWGTSATTTIDSQGVASWSGTYDNHHGEKFKKYTVKGYWDGTNFHISARRGPWRCNGSITMDTDNIPGLSARPLRFKTFDPGDYGPVMSGSGQIMKEHTLRGKLFYDQDTPDPKPLVVLMHGFGGIGGAKAFFVEMPKRIAEVGGATLVIRHKLSIDIPGRTVDTFKGIEAAVKKFDFIDPDRIYLVGLSAGGMSALNMAQHAIYDRLNEGSYSIAGMVLAYPSCRVKFVENDVLPIPVTILAGAKDKETPASDCASYIEEVGGQNFITLTLFPNAGHSWAFSHGLRTSQRKSWAGCGRLVVHPNGQWSNEAGTLHTKDMTFYEWIDRMQNTCRKEILHTYGRDQEAYDATIKAVLNMLRVNKAVSIQ